MGHKPLVTGENEFFAGFAKGPDGGVFLDLFIFDIGQGLTNIMLKEEPEWFGIDQHDKPAEVFYLSQ